MKMMKIMKMMTMMKMMEMMKVIYISKTKTCRRFFEKNPSQALSGIRKKKL